MFFFFLDLLIVHVVLVYKREVCIYIHILLQNYPIYVVKSLIILKFHNAFQKLDFFCVCVCIYIYIPLY